MNRFLVSLYARHKNLISLTILIVLVFIFIAPIFYNIEKISHNTDWASHFSILYVARLSLLEFKQFPLWSPHLGGGYPLIGHIEEISMTPAGLLNLFFGEIIAMKILCVILYLIGTAGTFYLTRHILKYTLSGTFFSVLVFVLVPFFTKAMFGGDPKQLHYLLYPLMLALFIRGQDNKKFLFFCSLLLTLLIFEADFVSLVFLLFLALYILAGLLKKDGGRIVFNLPLLFNFFLLILLSSLIGAVKILPLMKTLSINPRIITTYQTTTLGASSFSFLLENLLRYSPTVHGQFQLYIGLFPVVLSVFCFLIFWKELKLYLIPLVVFIWISMGPYAPVDLWRLLRHLPFFHSQKDLGQYYPIVVVLIIAIVGGKFFSLSERYNRKLPLRLLFIVLISLYAIMRFPFMSHHFNLFTQRSIEETQTRRPFGQVKILPYRDYDPEHDEGRDLIGPLQYFLLKENLGTINWKGGIQLAENTIPKYFMVPNYFFLGNDGTYSLFRNPDYKREVFFLNNDNVANLKYFSPLKLLIDVDIKNPDTLIINQNYNTSWRVRPGSLLSYNGLLGVKLKNNGHYLVELNYIPLEFYIGLFISLTTLLCILLGYFYLRPKKMYSNTGRYAPGDSNRLQKKSLKDNVAIFIGIITLLFQAFSYFTTKQIGPIKYSSSNQEEIKTLQPASKFSTENIYGLKKWKVGQYATYKITDLYENGSNYIYKVTLIDKEVSDETEYFWVEHALYDSKQNIRAKFKFLMPALSVMDLEKNPLWFFRKGIYPENAKRLIVQFEDNPAYEVNPDRRDEMIKLFFTIPFPDAILHRKQDYNKKDVSIYVNEDMLTLPSGKIDCYRFLIEVPTRPLGYRFHVWRSKEVPILGLVRMELYKIREFFDRDEFPNKIALIDYGEY